MTTVAQPTNVGGMTYTLTPTETDGSIVSYEFTYDSDLWDYVTETLAYEYGMDSTDIVGTEVYGYHNAICNGLRQCHYANGGPVCEGHVIGSVTRT